MGSQHRRVNELSNEQRTQEIISSFIHTSELGARRSEQRIQARLISFSPWTVNEIPKVNCSSLITPSCFPPHDMAKYMEAWKRYRDIGMMAICKITYHFPLKTKTKNEWVLLEFCSAWKGFMSCLSTSLPIWFFLVFVLVCHVQCHAGKQGTVKSSTET